jgi:hypothetical protein
MAAPLNTCTTIEQRGVVRFLWAKNMEAKDIHIQEMLPICAAFPVCGYPLLANIAIQGHYFSDNWHSSSLGHSRKMAAAL